MEPPLDWLAAENACRLMGSDTHLASVTSLEQQHAVAHLAQGQDQDHLVWIGLNDIAEEGSWVWSDDEPLEYSHWFPGAPAGGVGANAAALYASDKVPWLDNAETNVFPYICAKKATPIEASGGDMLGCRDGHWVMGTPYKRVGSLNHLPPTIVRHQPSFPPSDTVVF